jgi:hypothetical protein
MEEVRLPANPSPEQAARRSELEARRDEQRKLMEAKTEPIATAAYGDALVALGATEELRSTPTSPSPPSR